MFGFGMKANPKSVLFAVRMVIASKIVLLTGCVVAVVSQGTWLASVPSVVHPLFLLLLHPMFLMFLIPFRI